MVGFSGTETDRVGPGDYEVSASEGIVRKNVVGVTTWRKPEEPPELIKSIQDMKRKAPDPGDYDQKHAKLAIDRGNVPTGGRLIRRVAHHFISRVDA